MYNKINLSTIVSRQVPEFIRDDYPAFVEFIKAYYAYLDQTENRSIESYRDVDQTLESFISKFRQELDVFGQEYDYIDPRFFLRKSGQLLVSTGGEASYKFLLKVLFNKDAQVLYPWDQVLKPSDGKWQQETSLFVRMSAGNAQEFVGNNVDIISGNSKLRVFVERIRDVEDLVKLQASQLEPGETYKIYALGNTDFKTLGASDNLVGVSFVATGPGEGGGIVTVDKKLYEVYIDKNYYGQIKPTDKLELIQNSITFDSILDVNLSNQSIDYVGHGFITGDPVVYSYNTDKSVGGLENNVLYYVIKIDNDSFRLATTLKNAKAGTPVTFSSPGIGSYHNLQKINIGTVIPTSTKYEVVKGGSGFRKGDIINAKTISSGKIITQKLKVTHVDSNGAITGLATIQFGYDYQNDFFVIQPSPRGSAYTAASRVNIQRGISTLDTVYDLNNDSIIEQYTDYGYIINPNYVEYPATRPAYSDISYAAELLEQYYQETQTQLAPDADYAIIKFNIGAVAKYPGQFITNDGFLDDDVVIQDSYRWQKYSYVIRISEKLEAYKTLVKSLLHPAGTQLIGEYEIAYENNIQMLDGVFNVSDCEFTGSIFGNVLTVTEVREDQLFIGSTITGDGTLDNTKITAFVTGTGLTGTYIVSRSQVVEQQALLGRRPTVVGQNVQDLGQWRSAATFGQINTSISNMYLYPADLGGWIRKDPWDVSYSDPREIYGDEAGSVKFWGDERNVANGSTYITIYGEYEAETGGIRFYGDERNVARTTTSLTDSGTIENTDTGQTKNF